MARRDPVTEQGVPTEWIGVGERLRGAREAAGISMRELARRVEVSPGHISNVERGLASLSVRSLYTIVSELQISMDSLFVKVDSQVHTGDSSEKAGRAADSPGQALALGELEAKGVVMRRLSRPSIPLPTGTRWERLTPHAEMGAEFIEVIYPPSKESSPPEEFVLHSSREYGVITHGSLTIQVGFDTAVLNVGDSIAFDSTTPHRYWNETDEEVRAVWFIADTSANSPAAGPESSTGHF
ncbi:MAG: helix-turn-helix transcriptional regulator [Actinobacteria bacterium]|nr:helix-turn-helix transcriptional regulator [Actinomycetota bacterium]MBT5501106.1 helix-turn-helix transcriptional regulator [Actinomycetota bacterium]MBT5807459.1 helix-turn-helix transcriptional regulator [Actinomycetota bacterium]HBK39382.1 XRE family transcriptional regulator [Actinomycetota bacterium]